MSLHGVVAVRPEGEATGNISPFRNALLLDYIDNSVYTSYRIAFLSSIVLFTIC